VAELPRMPTKDEILARATELFMQERARVGLPPLTPEESELKEGSYFDRARNELMSGVRSQLEGYLAYLEGEAAKVREELGIVEVIPEEKITELENKLSDISERYRVTKERLKEARAELERIKAPPTPIVPIAAKGLSKEQISQLEDSFKRVFEEAGVARVPLATFRDEISILKEDLKDVERSAAFELAYRRITELARSILPPRPVMPPPAPPPVPERPPLVERAAIPAIAQLGPRRRLWETFTCMVEGCLETVKLDRDLMYRVTVIPVLMAIRPRGPVFEPLIGFSPRFFYICPRHRKERHGYTGIYDALAFIWRESEVGEKFCVTEATFREIGLDDEDVREIRRERVKYLPARGFPLSS